MEKNEIILQLKALGFEFNDRGGSVSTVYHIKELDTFSVYILISNKVRVLIETSGKGTYFILLKEINFTFKESNISQIVKEFNLLVKACEEFNKILL